MKKIKRDYFILILSFVVIILSINFVIAEFTLGNPASNIEKTYGQGEVVKGWINISFKNQETVSLLSGFGKSMNLLSFLEATGASYSCFPADCEDSYASSSGGIEKTLNFAAGDKKLVGIKLTGQVNSIDSLVFNVSTLGSSSSCSIPLKIDILNDDSFEWQAKGVSNELCVINAPYGCYNEGDYVGETFLITENSYCAKTKVSSGKKFKIGADILGETGKGGNVNFKMEINNELETQECTASANTSGSISCIVELDEGITKETEVGICISVYDEVDNGKYKIKYEIANACGSAGAGKYDFPIFIYPFKYSKINNFIFNQNLVNNQGSGTDLGTELSKYISDKYKGNCNPECIIPINFYSGETQDIFLSNLNLIYTVDGSKSETKIYNISKKGVLITSSFQKLDLAKANFITPFITGEGSFILELGNKEILRETIKILLISKIIGFEPNRASALVPTNFIAHISEYQNNLTYIWGFGDKSMKEVSDTNQMKHTYTSTGDYLVEVIVKNNLGNSSKTFSVKVIPPEEAILEILTEDKEKIIVLKSQINALPEWVKIEIEKSLDIKGMEEDIKTYEKQYEEAFNEDSYVNLMKTLLEFKVPSGLTISKQITKGALFLSKEQLNLDILESLGAGKIEEEDYDTVINTWLARSLDASIEFKTYALEYEGVKEDFISYIKVSLEPNENLGEVYFIVNGDPSEIIFSDESNTKKIGEKAEVLVFDELAETKTIEFLYPGGVEIGNFPIYIAPEFKNLDFGVNPGICNFNKVCEKNLKEDWKNCRNDCKPYLLMFLFLTGLIFAFLIVYIALQEWYKRHYESKLFPDKNQLFNLINFINNSLNQGLKKSEIFSNLKDLDWSEEQLKYAWNKFNGKRTGMWEIPVFKWIENKQVKRELKKRQDIPIQTINQTTERSPKQIRQPKPNLRRFRYR